MQKEKYNITKRYNTIIKNFNVVLAAVSALLLLSCSKQSIEGSFRDSEGENVEYLHRRPDKDTIILSLPKEDMHLSGKNNLRAIQNLSFLGLSIHPERELIGEDRFFGYPILDYEKMEKKSDIIKRLKRNRSEGSYIVFNSKESLQNNLQRQYSGTLNIGFNLPKLFSIGIEGKFGNIFNLVFSYSSERAFAWARVNYAGDKIFIVPSEKNYQSIATRFLDQDFLANLYNVPMSHLFDTYSQTFISGFYQGGRANLLLYAERKNASIDIHKSLSDYLSFSLKPANDGDSGSLSFNHNENAKKVAENNFSIIAISYNYVGGKNHSMNFSSPKEPKEGVSVNFTPWLQSLTDDASSHTFVDFVQDGGLEPVYKYIKEENFQQRIKQNSLNSKFYTPKIYISIGKYYPPGSFLSAISNPSEDYSKPGSLYVTLSTRHGDLIRLRPIKENDANYWFIHSEEDWNKKAQELCSILQQYYNVDIIKIGSYKSLWGGNQQVNSIYDFSLPVDSIPPHLIHAVPVEIDFYGLKEGNFRKAHHPSYSGIELLLYTDGRGRNMAYSIYNTRILSAYGLQDTYRKAPVTSISAEELQAYRIIGL